MSVPTAALLVPDPPVWRSVLVRGLICLAFCLVLALLQAVVVDDWRAPLVGSLSVGGICWLFVDSSRAVLARWRWRRLQRLASDPGPAPDGTYRNWPGWPWMGLLAVAGSCMGVLGGQALMRGLGLDSGLPPLGPIVLLSVGVTLLISYFFYIREHATLSQKQAEAARRVALETQLRLLQAQLEPHMLFNTLANLRVLIQLDAAKAQAMLDHLIGFLRATLQASRNEWQTLQEEFDQVQDYLALMQVRMGARLQVDIRLDEAVRGVLVPPLLLQPLVENAIVHGLEPQPEGGRLSLRAWRERGEVRVQVKDTGRGLHPAAPHPSGERSNPGTDYGLQHVRDRLRSTWGEQAGLRLEAVAEGGTLATVSLPAGGSAGPSVKGQA